MTTAATGWPGQVRAANWPSVSPAIRVTNMWYPLVDGVPLFGSRFIKTVLTATSLAPGASFGDNQLTYMEDTWLSQSHVGTHLDGMGHMGIKDCYYNQTPMGKFINQNMVTLYILRPACRSATLMTAPLSIQAFLHAGLVLSLPAFGKP